MARESFGGLLFLLGVVFGIISELVRPKGSDPIALTSLVVLLAVVA